jgi:AcrR family transcriptional regulator
MSRKELILKKALALFNEKGFNDVSTYDIAKAVGISQGNLTYHYPTKKKLVNTLAKNMIEEIDLLVLHVGPGFSFIDFYENLTYTFTINLKYHFLYMNYSQIVLNDEDLNRYFLQNSADRKVLLRRMLKILSDNDLLTKNSIIKLNDKIADTINLIAVYWVSESKIYHQGKSNSQIISHHIELIFLLFRPFLTARGRENFKEISQLTI